MNNGHLASFRRSMRAMLEASADQFEPEPEPEEVLGQFEGWIRIQARHVLGETVGQELLQAVGLEPQDTGTSEFDVTPATRYSSHPSR